MSEPRTWLLNLMSNTCFPLGRSDERVGVIELDPVLDLLERAREALDYRDRDALVLGAEIGVLLKDHVRLA